MATLCQRRNNSESFYIFRSASQVQRVALVMSTVCLPGKLAYRYAAKGKQTFPGAAKAIAVAGVDALGFISFHTALHSNG